VGLEPLIAEGSARVEPLLEAREVAVPLVERGDRRRVHMKELAPVRAHALLLHLEAVGFEGAPRFLGLDSRGREVLSYIPGTAIVEPYPDWALTDKALISVAELLRAYHDAASTFDPFPYSWAPAPPEGFVGDIVTHNDINLDNVVFRDARAVALIDFDLAGPGSRAGSGSTLRRSRYFLDD